MVTDHGGGIGTELSGGTVIGSRGPAEGERPLLAEIVPPQAAYALVDSDMAGEHPVDQLHVLFHKSLLLTV